MRGRRGTVQGWYTVHLCASSCCSENFARHFHRKTLTTPTADCASVPQHVPRRRKSDFHVLGHVINRRHHKQKVHPSSYGNAFVTLEDRNYGLDLKTKFPFPTLFSKAPPYGCRPRHTSSRNLFDEVTKANVVSMNG